jgi:methyl acetate hydrolase
MKKSSVLLIVLAWMSATTHAQTMPALAPAAVSEIDAILQRAVQQGTAPGVVAMVATRDRVIYEGALGLRDTARQRPMEKDSIFRIASMTKPFTSVAVMMLVEQGRLSLDDAVSKFLPSFRDREVIATFNPGDATFTTKKASREILIRHLLSNTSGMAYSFSNDTVSKLRQKLNKPPEELPLLYEPGTRWTYSGSTKVLGWVVEKLTGAGLDRFYDERIFQPLGLRDTSFVVPASKTSRVVTENQRENGKLVETPNPETIQSAVEGDGGLKSTRGGLHQVPPDVPERGEGWQRVAASQGVDSDDDEESDWRRHRADAAHDRSGHVQRLPDRRRT